jgi:hypothetical protein
MSAYPRTVLTGVTVDRDGGQTFVKSGSAADIKPGISTSSMMTTTRECQP